MSKNESKRCDRDYLGACKRMMGQNEANCKMRRTTARVTSLRSTGALVLERISGKIYFKKSKRSKTSKG